MWKLMAGTITESICSFVDGNDKLPVEQKECRKSFEEPKINF